MLPSRNANSHQEVERVLWSMWHDKLGVKDLRGPAKCVRTSKVSMSIESKRDRFAYHSNLARYDIWYTLRLRVCRYPWSTIFCARFLPRRVAGRLYLGFETEGQREATGCGSFVDMTWACTATTLAWEICSGFLQVSCIKLGFQHLQNVGTEARAPPRPDILCVEAGQL